MSHCIACGNDCQVSGFDGDNWFYVDCKTFCSFEIHRVAIKRIKASKNERNRFVMRLENACKGDKLLKVSYQPSSSEKPTLKFSDEPKT